MNMKMVITIAAGILLAILLLPLLGLAMPVAIVIGILFGIVLFVVSMQDKVEAAKKKNKEREKYLSKLSESDRKAAEKRFKQEDTLSIKIFLFIILFVAIVSGLAMLSIRLG